MKKFKKWCIGSLTIVLSQDNNERFFNLCKHHNIILTKISTTEYNYQFDISMNDLQMLRVIAKKAGASFKITKRHGFPFLWEKRKQNRGLLTGIGIFIFLIYFMSLFLWDISISGNSVHTEEQLLAFLKRQSISFGTRKSEIDCAKLEAQIRKEYPDISWVSVQKKGTRLNLMIKEARQPSIRTGRLTDTPCHMVAEKDGIVTSVIVRNGVPMVKSGDVVRAGDILISGIIPVIGDNDIVSAIHTVPADGDVVMKTRWEYIDSFSTHYNKKRYTGVQNHGISLFFGNTKLFSYTPRNSYIGYDIIKTKVTWKLTKNLSLPLNTEHVRCREYYLQECVYGNSELAELANERYLYWLEGLTASGAEIVSEHSEISLDYDVCNVTADVVVNEKVVTYREILPQEWNQEGIEER